MTSFKENKLEDQTLALESLFEQLDDLENLKADISANGATRRHVSALESIIDTVYSKLALEDFDHIAPYERQALALEAVDAKKGLIAAGIVAAVAAVGLLITKLIGWIKSKWGKDGEGRAGAIKGAADAEGSIDPDKSADYVEKVEGEASNEGKSAKKALEAVTGGTSRLAEQLTVIAVKDAPKHTVENLKLYKEIGVKANSPLLMAGIGKVAASATLSKEDIAGKFLFSTRDIAKLKGAQISNLSTFSELLKNTLDVVVARNEDSAPGQAVNILNKYQSVVASIGEMAGISNEGGLKLKEAFTDDRIKNCKEFLNSNTKAATAVSSDMAVDIASASASLEDLNKVLKSLEDSIGGNLEVENNKPLADNPFQMADMKAFVKNLKGMVLVGRLLVRHHATLVKQNDAMFKYISAGNKVCATLSSKASKSANESYSDANIKNIKSTRDFIARRGLNRTSLIALEEYGVETTINLASVTDNPSRTGATAALEAIDDFLAGV